MCKLISGGCGDSLQETGNNSRKGTLPTLRQQIVFLDIFDYFLKVWRWDESDSKYEIGYQTCFEIFINNTI